MPTRAEGVSSQAAALCLSECWMPLVAAQDEGGARRGCHEHVSQAIEISCSGVEGDLCTPDRVRALHFAKFCTTLHPFRGASHVPSGQCCQHAERLHGRKSI